MKQLHLWLAAILLLSGSFYAQAQTETDTTFASQMNYIFANVDKSKVPYGILRDYAMEFTNLDNYNGTAALADSNYTDGSVFWDAYNTLLMGRIHSSASGFVHPDTLDNQWFTYRQPGRITLAGLYFVYSRFKDNAANNYITVGNNQLYDKYVNGVWQNPYQSENIFLLSPSITDYHGTNFSILLPSNLWLTNNSTGVSGISINVNDGLGYRALVPGTAINVNYADTGTKEWVYKLTLTNSTVLYAHSRVHIANAINQSSGAARFRGATETITADVAYNGTKGIGYITIDYANADRQLHNPLIVAEGYDPGNIFNPEEPTGVMNIDNFIIDATNDGSQLTNLLSGAAQQYDIVYVDWKNGTDYLQRNALLLETVINIINNRKAAAGIVAPNVVVGQSMGGVIARYALKDMENNGERHQTRLFISHDAPQQDANVPQGYQHLGRHVKSLYVRMGIANITQQISLITTGVNIRRALSLADEPASKQMLINYVNSNNIIDNTVHDAWQTELKNLGYPNGDGVTPFRKVAISNGSECGTPQAFSAGSNLLTFNGKANTRFLGDIVSRTAFPVFGFAFGQPALFIGAYVGRNDFVFDIAANAQADGVGNQVYKGKITYTKKILWLISISITLTNRSYNSSASTLPYDYFPGGYYDLRNFNFDLQSSSYQGLFIKYNITASNQPTFNFVPTPSALDIGLGNTALSKADYLA